MFSKSGTIRTGFAIAVGNKDLKNDHICLQKSYFRRLREEPNGSQ